MVVILIMLLIILIVILTMKRTKGRHPTDTQGTIIHHVRTIAFTESMCMITVSVNRLLFDLRIHPYINVMVGTRVLVILRLRS